jgi:hypothetical protein
MATFAQSFKPAHNDAGVFPLSTGGPQAIDATSTTQNYALGTRIVAKDPVLGEAEFIYCKGVASTAKYEAIQINPDFTTTRAAGGTIKGFCGIAQSANVANQYGWYLIWGAGLVLIAGDVTANLTAYATATAGTVADDIVAGSAIVGMMLQEALDAGGSAIPNTTDTTPQHYAVAICQYPYVIKAV